MRMQTADKVVGMIRDLLTVDESPLPEPEIEAMGVGIIYGIAFAAYAPQWALALLTSFNTEEDAYFGLPTGTAATGRKQRTDLLVKRYPHELSPLDSQEDVSHFYIY